jgi:hypothetical protein
MKSYTNHRNLFIFFILQIMSLKKKHKKIHKECKYGFHCIGQIVSFANQIKASFAFIMLPFYGRNN